MAAALSFNMFHVDLQAPLAERAVLDGEDFSARVQGQDEERDHETEDNEWVETR